MDDPVVYLGLDVGAKRIGVASGNSLAKLASPLGIIEAGSDDIDEIKKIAKDEGAEAIVVGLPRGLDGQETAQTKAAREFAERVEKTGLQVHLQDEAGTSKQAAEESSKPGSQLDDKAAAIILQDFLDNL